MINISIARPTDESIQAVIQPDDGRWQVVVDKDGYPHLYVEVNVNAHRRRSPTAAPAPSRT